MSGYRTFDTQGIAGLTVQYSGNLLDTVIGFDDCLLSPPTTDYFRFKTGIVGFGKGSYLTGGTSGCIVRIEDIAISVGSLATSDAEGIAFITLVTGTITAGENLNDATPTTMCVALSTNLSMPFGESVKHSLRAKAVSVYVETNSIRVCYDGSSPTNAAESTDWASFGGVLVATDILNLKEWMNVKNFKWINAASSANSKVTVIFFY